MNRNALLRKIILSYPSAISERHLGREYAELRPLLKKNGLLEQVESGKMIEGDDSSLEEVIVRDNKPFISYDGGGVEEVRMGELMAWRFNLNAFCSHLASVLHLDSPEKYDVDGQLVFIGTKASKNGAHHIYLVLSDDIDEAAQLWRSIIKPQKVVIWLGDTRHIGVTPEVVISLFDFVSVEERGVLVDEEHFSKLIGSAGFGDSESTQLDKDILLDEKERNSFVLMFFKEGATFKYSENVRPQAARIIQHLYTIRKYGKCHLTAQEMADKNLAPGAKTISTRIGEVNRLCNKYKVKNLFHRFPGNEWGLNPELDCMQ